MTTLNPARPLEEKRMDGKIVSEKLLDSLRDELNAIKHSQEGQVPVLPKLDVVIVGEDPASQVYVKRKTKVAQEIGMFSDLHVLPADTTQATLCQLIDSLNADSSVHGILVQLPLPKHLDTEAILDRIAPHKDVDGFHPVNMGQLTSATSPKQNPPALPCTPAGVMTMLDHYNIELEGKHAVVVGRSNIVGKPMAILLLQRNATVTICHSRTKDLASVVRTADIIVAAVGIPRMITGAMVKEGAVVIDVGINRTAEGKLVGDVDFESVAPKAGFITPVPGGVGPMTIATLMQNTLALYKASVSK